MWAGHDFPMVLALSVGGSFISYIYSAPPLKLKQNGWLGNYALGSSYISLPWWCGQAMFGELNLQASYKCPRNPSAWPLISACAWMRRVWGVFVSRGGLPRVLAHTSACHVCGNDPVLLVSRVCWPRRGLLWNGCRKASWACGLTAYFLSIGFVKNFQAIPERRGRRRKFLQQGGNEVSRIRIGDEI